LAFIASVCLSVTEYCVLPVWRINFIIIDVRRVIQRIDRNALANYSIRRLSC